MAVKPHKGTSKDVGPDVIKVFQVRAMAAAGTDEKVMADYLGIPTGELKRKYRKDLKTGADWMKARIELTVAQKALAGDVRCALAWLKQYGGWTEVSRRELTGKDGEPISFRNLDGPSLDQVIKALREAGDAIRGGGRREPPTIDIGASGVRELVPLSWSADEGMEE